MTEKERLKYIEERRVQRSMERTGNRPRGSLPSHMRKEKNNSMAFRSYFTFIVAGGVFLISLFPSETSAEICSTIKTAIQKEISPAQIEIVKEYVTSLIKNGTFEPPSIETWSDFTAEESQVEIQEEPQEKIDGKTVYYPDIGNEP